ncbi:MAG: hypothetical protein VKJ02_03360 [Snowella sp.]|nr:hypothetical protein [Snowella sp.]
MNQSFLAFWQKALLISSGLTLWGLPSQAESLSLTVYPLLDSPTSAKCPKTLVIQETGKYHEGGYTHNGQANLSAIATNWKKHSSDPFSVTWVGTLKPEFQKCQASAGMTKIDKEAFDSHSYLRARLISGKVFLILDMTGLRDANNYTSTILKSSVTQGNPTWTWGGTD